MIRRGRILRAGEALTAQPADGARRRSGPRRVPAEEVAAHARAAEIVKEARARAETILSEARERAARLQQDAFDSGREAGLASLAAEQLAFASQRERHSEQALDDSVRMARLLSERLLGEALNLDPARVLCLARQTLREARGARQIRILAHPEDAAHISQALGSLGLHPGTSRVEADPALNRGDLRFITDIGVLEAAIGPQLNLLTNKLRDALKNG